jgi:hypothetical protein
LAYYSEGTNICPCERASYKEWKPVGRLIRISVEKAIPEARRLSRDSFFSERMEKNFIAASAVHYRFVYNNA